MKRFSVPRLVAAASTAAMLLPTPALASADCNAAMFNADFVAELAGDHPGRIFTAEVFDVRSGCSYSLHPGRVLTTASVHKIEILAGVLLEAQNDGRDLSTWERERIVPMITESANAAASELRNSIGGINRMRQLDDLFGLHDSTAVDPWGLTLTTAKDQVQLLRQTLVNAGQLFTPSSVDVFWDTMGKVTASQQWGISAGVPSQWTFALKNGFYSAAGRGWRINSSGIVVDAPGEIAYLVTILSEGWPSMSPGIEAVEHVGRHVSSHLTPGEPRCDQPTIAGTGGDDVILGTRGDDVIAGRGGNDTIDGRGGDDVLCGGPGNDVLYGRAGADVLHGDAGSDTLYGGNGWDGLIGGAGDDMLFGMAGRDVLVGSSGNDDLRGGKHRDRLDGRSGDDRVDGRGADDLLIGTWGTDRCVDPGTYEVWRVYGGCELIGP